MCRIVLRAWRQPWGYGFARDLTGQYQNRNRPPVNTLVPEQRFREKSISREKRTSVLSREQEKAIERTRKKESGRVSSRVVSLRGGALTNQRSVSCRAGWSPKVHPVQHERELAKYGLLELTRENALKFYKKTDRHGKFFRVCR